MTRDEQATPQRRQRTLLQSYPTYTEAAGSGLGTHAHPQGPPPEHPDCLRCQHEAGRVQIRRIRNGFGLYRREAIR